MNSPTTEHRLSGEELTCYRGDHLLFADVNFELCPGDILQIDGENGSGKTTLLRILCGLVLADEGEVFWQGKPLHKMRAEFGSQLTYVGHHNGFKGELTPIENLRMDRSLANARADMSPQQALQLLGLLNRDDVPCRALSAGQRRRVALARLLVTNTKLWILDEPLTALDVRGRAVIEAELIKHAQAGGMVVFTTHHPLQLGDYPLKTLHLNP